MAKWGTGRQWRRAEDFTGVAVLGVEDTRASLERMSLEFLEVEASLSVPPLDRAVVILAMFKDTVSIGQHTNQYLVTRPYN